MALSRNIKITAATIFLAIAISFLPLTVGAFSTPAIWDFGEVQLGSESLAIVTIATSSNENVILTSLLLQNGTDFKVITEIPAGGILIPPNQSVGIEISYTPKLVGPGTDSLYIYTNNPFIGRGIVNLSGIGISSKEIQINDILEFFDAAVASGSLTGDDGAKLSANMLSYAQNNQKSGKAGKSSENRLNAFRNMLKSVDNMIQDGNTSGACAQALNVYHKTDGQSPPISAPDFVAGEAKEELARMVLDFSEQLHCE